MGERDASRLVNVPRNLRFLVCERIALRFVNAVNGGTPSLNQVAVAGAVVTPGALEKAVAGNAAAAGE
jgi:hypothetical protein